MLLVGLLGVVPLALAFGAGVKLFRQVLIYTLPFYAGVCVKKYGFAERLFGSQAAVTACLIAATYLLPHYTAADKSLLVLAVRLMTGLTVTEVLYCFVCALGQRPAQPPAPVKALLRCLCLLGRRSMEIYLISGFFTPLFPRYGGTDPFRAAVNTLVCALLVCFGSLLAAEILQTSDLLAAVLFGKKMPRRVAPSAKTAP